jgi:hypothetical protein
VARRHPRATTPGTSGCGVSRLHRRCHCRPRTGGISSRGPRLPGARRLQAVARFARCDSGVAVDVENCFGVDVLSTPLRGVAGWSGRL